MPKVALVFWLCVCATLAWSLPSPPPSPKSTQLDSLLHEVELAPGWVYDNITPAVNRLESFALESHEHQRLLREHGGVKTLCAVLVNKASRAATVEAVLRLLAALAARGVENVRALREDGAIAALESTLRGCHSELVCNSASRALSRMAAAESASKTTIAAFRALPQSIGMALGSNQDSESSQKALLELTLALVDKSDAPVKAAWRADLSPWILTTFRGGWAGSDVTELGLHVLLALSECTPNVSLETVTLGAMQQHLESTGVQKAGARALHCFATGLGGSPSTEAQIRAETETLASTLAAHVMSPVVVEPVARLLAALSCKSSAAANGVLRSRGIGNAMLDAMRAHPNDLRLLEAGAALLECLAVDDVVQTAIHEHGGPALLAELMDAHHGSSAGAACERALLRFETFPWRVLWLRLRRWLVALGCVAACALAAHKFWGLGALYLKLIRLVHSPAPAVHAQEQPAHSSRSESLESECPICMDAVANIAIVPCGHRVCEPCFGTLQFCGACRGAITNSLRVY
eukprot:a676561_5.p1 GENE.a676561_5~~a676561_5.p1  ORF type:complete len:534 (+),score=80.65 a676561_5:38-1603(+)